MAVFWLRFPVGSHVERTLGGYGYPVNAGIRYAASVKERLSIGEVWAGGECVRFYGINSQQWHQIMVLAYMALAELTGDSLLPPGTLVLAPGSTF